MVPKNEKSDTEIKQGVVGFQKSYVIFGVGKYVKILTGVGEWTGKGQKHPYVI